MTAPSKPKTHTQHLCQATGCDRERTPWCAIHVRSHELLRLTRGDELDRVLLVEICAHLAAVARHIAGTEPLRSVRIRRAAQDLALLLPPAPAKGKG